MADYHIQMVRGDTLSFGLEFDGLDQDLDTAFFTCKENALDDNFLFQKSIGDGITKVDENQYIVRVAPDDTRDLNAGQYRFDFEITVNGDVFTILNGVIDIEQDVTF